MGLAKILITSKDDINLFATEFFLKIQNSFSLVSNLNKLDIVKAYLLTPLFETKNGLLIRAQPDLISIEKKESDCDKDMDELFTLLYIYRGS